jgi:LacI family transcriptional regulator
MTRRPTIIDVALRAKVSKSTVSLVLQNSATVKPETVASVRAAMKDLSYVYNRAAANMRSANVGLIGLVINDLRNPFFTEFATSAQMALSKRGYATVIANTDEDPVIQAQVVNSMIEHGISALIISPTYGQESATYGPLARAGIPVIQVLRRAAGAQFPFASFDYCMGGRLATQHLIQQGMRKIAFIGGLADRPITTERMSGYLEVMDEAGLQPLVLHGRSSRSFGREAADTLLRSHPDCDASVCFNDLVALGLMAGFAASNKVMGRDFRLVGFDNIEECALVYPQVSSINCDIAIFAENTANTLIAWLEEQIVPEAETRAGVDLKVRASSIAG